MEINSESSKMKSSLDTKSATSGKYPEIVFTSILLIILAAAIITAFDYPPAARRLPLIVGIPALGLCVIVLFQAVFRSDGATETDEGEEVTPGPQRAFWLTVATFPVLFLLFGFPWGASIYMLLVLLATKTCGPIKAIAISVCTVAPAYYVFGVWLNVPVFSGLVFA